MTRMVSELTKLGLFILVNRLRPSDVARDAGITRQYLGRLRFGEAEATRPMMIRVARACSQLLRRPVSVEEVFDLEDRP